MIDAAPQSTPTTNRTHLRRWRIINVFAFAGLAFLVVYFLTSFHFHALLTDENKQVDFQIWYGLPRYMFDHLRYPASETGKWVIAIFPYPPSAAAMFLPLQLAPQLISFGFWLALQVVAFATVLWVAARLSGACDFPGWPVIALIAALFAENALSWDLRNHNNNLIYLALVMLGLFTRRIWASALLMALSFNFKVYSGGLIFSLAWRREYRLAIGMAFAAIMIAVFLPMAVFGNAALPQLFSDWIEQVRYIADPANQVAYPVSLLRAATKFLAADPTSDKAILLLRATQIAWLGLVAAYFLLARRVEADRPAAYDQVRLADACVALMAPLPLSVWFLPYHGVVMIPAFMLLLTVVVQNGWTKYHRITAIAVCLGCQGVRFVVPDWNYRGAVFLAEFVLLVMALAVMRWHLTRPSDSAAGNLEREKSLEPTS